MNGDARADQLIAELGLKPHPEGGHFREIFRSARQVSPSGDRGTRSALTVIFFLLRAGEVSRLHRVVSDEAWHFQEGDPLDLQWWLSEDDRVERRRLGPVAVEREDRPTAVVPAGAWQGARTTGRFTLVACTVGPGFDFEDFELIDAAGALASTLRTRHPELRPFLEAPSVSA
ncbi:MAG: cupin domain-containing protein [Acidobacteriota bacterium]